MLEYKGYIGHVVYDDAFKIFHGDVINMKDVVTFQGRHVDELEQAFRDSVDCYLAFCEEEGVEPSKPFSGKFMVRVNPDLHRDATISAKAAGLSLNAWVARVLQNETSKSV